MEDTERPGMWTTFTCNALYSDDLPYAKEFIINNYYATSKDISVAALGKRFGWDDYETEQDLYMRKVPDRIT